MRFFHYCGIVDKCSYFSVDTSREDGGCAPNRFPNLKIFRKALKKLICYQANYGIVEDPDYLCPQTVSAPSVDNSCLAAHNAALKVTKTFEQIALLFNRAVEQEIPAAQRARFRHLC